jgi:hypothetical protein
MQQPVWVAGFSVSNRVHELDRSRTLGLWVKEGRTGPTMPRHLQQLCFPLLSKWIWRCMSHYRERRNARAQSNSTQPNVLQNF